MDNEQQEKAQEDDAAAPVGESPAAHRIADDIRERMSSLQPNAAEGVEHAADAVRQAAGGLRDQEAWLAPIVEQGADKLSELAQTLRTNDPQALLSKTEQFARRQPVLFTGAAMAIGFALARAATAAVRGGPSRPSREVARVRD
jgi:hypothetical protein